MADASEHLGHVAAHLADTTQLSRFISRVSISGGGDEIIVALAGRNLAIRAAGQSLRIGSEEIALGADAQGTLNRVAIVVGRLLAQIDEQGI